MDVPLGETAAGLWGAGAQASCPGSGLGLAIVAEIATAHGGSAKAALNHPHGLRITLTLPASPVAPQA